MLSFSGKKVLFITTKNVDYIRNQQEIKLLERQSGEIEIIGSKSKNYLARVLIVYLSLLFKSIRRFDVIFIGFSPQLVLPAWGWKLGNKKIVIDFFISCYDTFVCDRKLFKENSLGSKILKALDIKTLQRADAVIADTKCHGEYFIKELQLARAKLEVLYLEADRDIYYPRIQKKPDRMNGKYVVLYFGSILPLQGVPIVLKAVQMLEKNKELYFLIIGPVNDKLDKPIADNIEYHQWLPQELLAEYISYADLCLAGHFNGQIGKAKRTIPGKAFIYQAMDKPMILGDNPANRELYHEENINIHYAAMGNAHALADKIMEIKELK